jgi:hypothetical protein
MATWVWILIVIAAVVVVALIAMVPRNSPARMSLDERADGLVD